MKHVVVMFKAEHSCVSCNKVVSFNTKISSYGVCPHCGAVSGNTVMNTKVQAVIDTPTESMFSRLWKFITG